MYARMRAMGQMGILEQNTYISTTVYAVHYYNTTRTVPIRKADTILKREASDIAQPGRPNINRESRVRGSTSWANLPIRCLGGKV